MISAGVLLVILLMCTDAVRQPTIIVHENNDDSLCNRPGATCPSGYYCYEECRRCSSCPDVNTYRLPHNRLTVMGDCLRQGLCPDICSDLHLQPHQQANQSFCSLIPTRDSDCNLQSCDNGGTLDTQACQCTCQANWIGATCSECGLSCQNGGTLDDSDCQCGCDENWTGANCTDCALKLCSNGGMLDPASCQCLCSGDWTGDGCSECGLKFCRNGGTLNPAYCQCLCSDNWTGHNCSESNVNGGLKPTQTKVTGEVPPTWNVLIGAGVLLVAVVLIVTLLLKFRCIRKLRSTSDAESPFIEYVGDMDAECLTPRSIKVWARNPSKKLKGKKMKFFCRGQDPSEKWSDAKTWESALQHTFEGLRPGVKYTVSLHPYQDSQVVNKVEATTPYYPLTVEVSGSSVVISDLTELGINAVQGCPCMMLKSCKKWMIIGREEDEIVIPDIPPGLDYLVKAGVVDVDRLPSQQEFQCKAEGKLHVDMPETTPEQRTGSCPTFVKLLESIELTRSLQVQLDSTDCPYLPEMVANVLGLNGDDYLRIKNAQSDHLELLHTILNSTGNDTLVHTLIEGLLLMDRSREAEAVHRNESEDFLIKLVRHTWTSYRCHQCIRLLHQGHSV